MDIQKELFYISEACKGSINFTALILRILENGIVIEKDISKGSVVPSYTIRLK